MTEKKPFGGYTINFKPVKDTTLEEVFGVKPIPPSEMTKLIWKFVKENELSSKPPKEPIDELKDYWDSTYYGELELTKFNALLVKAGGTKKTLKTSSKIFDLQEDEPEEFEEQIDKFYESFLKSH